MEKSSEGACLCRFWIERNCFDLLSVQSIFESTSWVHSTNPSTLQRNSARAVELNRRITSCNFGKEAHNLNRRHKEAQLGGASQRHCEPGPLRIPAFHARVYLTECAYQLVSQSQHPYQIVNLLFTITSKNIKLPVFWGS